MYPIIFYPAAGQNVLSKRVQLPPLFFERKNTTN